MWHRKSILLLCPLLLFIFFSTGFGQTGHITPIKGFFSADSGNTRATEAKVPLYPVGIRPSLIDRDRSALSNQQVEGALLSPASDSQWVSFHFSSTQWQWNIRKPGDYAAQPIIGSIISSVDVLIDFNGFEDLNATYPPTQKVETYYGVSIGNQGVEEVEWARASDLNAHSLLIRQNPIPTHWSLWNKICVKADNSDFKYLDDAVITFGILNTSPWIDPEIPTGQ